VGLHVLEITGWTNLVFYRFITIERRRKAMDLRARLGNGMRIARNNRGFTLIEMAIVLIIIGIILGAVVKGKDLIRSGEQKKVYSKFVNAWRTCYLNYYDRTGKILGDTTGDNLADEPSDYTANVINKLKETGLTPPTTNTGDACKYRYSDSQGGSHDVQVNFAQTTDKANVLVIKTIPAELSIAIDRIVDGKADGTDGDFLTAAGASSPYTPGGSDWGTDPTNDDTKALWKMEF